MAAKVVISTRKNLCCIRNCSIKSTFFLFLCNSYDICLIFAARKVSVEDALCLTSIAT